jgi:hypothetical protein
MKERAVCPDCGEGYMTVLKGGGQPKLCAMLFDYLIDIFQPRAMNEWCNVMYSLQGPLVYIPAARDCQFVFDFFVVCVKLTWLDISPQ